MQGQPNQLPMLMSYSNGYIAIGPAFPHADIGNDS